MIAMMELNFNNEFLASDREADPFTHYEQSIRPNGRGLGFEDSLSIPSGLEGIRTPRPHFLCSSPFSNLSHG
jgi:hypothetical protein